MECSSGEPCDTGSCSSAKISRPLSESGAKLCYKCKEAPAQMVAYQTDALCNSCLNASIFSKFKTAINVNELIHSSDKVLLAFSGGPSSRVALDYLLEIREKAKRDAIHSTTVKVFGFGVVHVDESSIIPFASLDPETLHTELKEIVMGGLRTPDEFHVIPLESVYSSDKNNSSESNNNDGTSKKEILQMLMRSVADMTGKEDLMQHIRMQTLQQFAVKNGYTKVVLGLSTTRIAAKVISATAKGQGFSLPSEIQFYDARWNVPVVLPLRDCVIKELSLVCHFRRLKYVFIPTMSTLSTPQHNINSLSANFISLLLEDNPAKEKTIMRTAAKLQPFSFNRPPALAKHSSTMNGLHNMNDTEVGSLCNVCYSPLSTKEIMMRRSAESSSLQLDEAAQRFLMRCCSTCRFQIMDDSYDVVYSLLPDLVKSSDMVNPSIRETWMRSQIDKWLIDDCDCDD